MKIQILIDNPSSWYVPFGIELRKELLKLGHDVMLIHDHGAIQKGDILCLLACEKVCKSLKLNTHNLVVHESDLPKGKGWSPVTWQVLNGERKIPVTLFEATEEIDAGVIYKQSYIILEGHELLHEIKNLQGEITNNLILNFIKRYPDNKGVPQEGDATYYRKRTPKDSELDIDKSIREQFQLLRIVDNDRYPAFFKMYNKKYVVKIEKIEN